MIIRRLSLAGVILMVMAVAVFGGFGSSTVAKTLQNTAHVPAFGFIALLAFIGLRDSRQPQTPLRNYFFAFGIAVALGVLVELAQSLLGRDAELDDVIHNSLGAMAALSFVAAYHAKRSRGWMAAWLCCGLVTAMIGLYPAAWVSAAWLKQKQQFPTLIQFDSKVDAFFLRSTADIQFVSFPAALARISDEQALRLPLVGGNYPGVEIVDPYPDWRGHRELVTDIANPTDKPLRLYIRVNDRAHNFDSTDRWSGTILLPPHSRQTDRFALTDIQSAPRTRHMDMSDIVSVIIFSNPQPGSAVLLKSLALE